jgi:biopolymer transport protein ExbD
MTGYFRTKPLEELTEKFRPQEPVVIETPKSVSTPIVIDSSYFRIKVYKDRFELELFKKMETIKTLTGVDRYIKANKSRIDSNKIILMGNTNLNYQEIKPVFEVLKKNGYHKFKMVTEKPGG